MVISKKKWNIPCLINYKEKYPEPFWALFAEIY